MTYAMCPQCHELFALDVETKKYCSEACATKAAKKRYKAVHPEQIREEKKRYKAAHPEQVREEKKRYKAAHPEQVREEKKRYKQAHPLNAMTKPFVAWDGEGEDGKYTLLANSRGQSIVNREKGLSTVQCLDFLLDAPYGKNNVWFAFGYDVAMMLHDIPIVSSTGPSLLELHTKGSLDWKGYHITYFPKKKFIVAKGNRSFVSYDTFSFFQTKFTKVIDAWAGGIPELVAKGKEARDEFTSWDMDTITEYNRLECEALVTTMDKFRQALESAGLELTSWHGPGALANAWLKKHHIADYIAEPPDAMAENVLQAYFGGRIEIAGWGYTPKVFHYDINSAYPTALCDCISLRDVNWRLTPGMPTDPFTLCHVKWNCALHSNEAYQWGPLPYRMSDGSILYPPEGEGWYWGVEVFAAQKRFPQGIEVIEHWKPLGPKTYPFRDAVRSDAAKRLQWKREGFPGHVPLKLVLNSLYGKLAQKIGYIVDGRYQKPTFQCHIWAGYVTAYTRAMLTDALRLAGGQVVCVMTDSVWSLTDLSDKLSVGSDLGEWEYSPEDESAAFCGAGLYCAYDANGNERPQEYKSRGFSLDQGQKLDYRAIVQSWEKTLADGAWDGDAQTYTIRRFIGIGQAVRQKKFRPYFGRFIEMPRTLQNLAMYGQTKRLGHVVFGSTQERGIHWMPACPVPVANPGTLFACIPQSAPYKLGQIEEEAGPEVLEMLAAREDEE